MFRKPLCSGWSNCAISVPLLFAAMSWTSGVAIVVLGSWLICYSPQCAATDFDTKLMEWLAQRHNPIADRLFLAITWLGSTAVLAPFVIAGMFALLFRGHVREAYFFAAALAGTIATSHISKLIVARPRPADAAALIATPWVSSFPSAHAAQIAGVMLASLVIVYRLNPIWFTRLWLVALVVVVLVALSRIYLQVHYPSDVMTGMLIGALWVAGLASLMLRRLNWQ